MAKMSQEVQDLFNEVADVVLATARKDDAQPNACIIGAKRIIDDETIYISDQFFNKTLANIRENGKVSIVFWGDNGAAYQIHGTASYVTEGEQYEQLRAGFEQFFKDKGLPIVPKGGVFVHVDEVYSSAPGPHAGEKIA